MPKILKPVYFIFIFSIVLVAILLTAFTVSITGSRYRAYLPHELAVAFVDLGDNSGLTETILGFIREYGENEDRETDNPMGWAQYRRMQQSDEKGEVKPDGWIRAAETRKSIIDNLRPDRAMPMTALAPVAGISRSGWTALGPGNIGGRIRSIIFDPKNSSKMWIGTAGGGVWKSTDAGSTWSPAGDFMGSLSVSTLATPSGSASVIYAGTGEGFYNGDAIRGAGIFKSTDGGTTWQQLSSTNPANNADWYAVNRISVHPTNPNIILAATGGVCGGGNSSHLSGCGVRNGGVYRSTDAGATWTLVRSSPSVSYYSIATDVKFNPSNGNLVVASFSNFESVSAYYSTDAGVTWKASNLPGYRKEFAWGSNSVVYASTCVTSYDKGGAVYVSTNGGQSWTLKSNPGHLPRQCWYDNAIWVDPTNNNHVVVAGVDIFRSLDGGTSWTQISQWQSMSYGSVHSDHHAIYSPPNYSSTKTVYFGNDGGLYKTNISLQTGSSYISNWVKLNNGLAITQFLGGDGHNGTNGHIYGGAQDNGSLVYSGTGTSWSDIYGGDGGFTQVDPTDGNYLYGEYVYLYVHRKTGSTSSARDIYSGITDAGSNALFYAPIRLDPNNTNTLYAGGASLWRSQNVKSSVPTWSAVSSSTNYITQIAVAKGNSNIVWFGDTGGKVYYSENATATSPTFTVKGAGTLPSRSLLSLLVDKSNNATVYAGFSGFNSGNLWKTTNSGASWTNISSNLPQSGILSIERHPNNANYLYVGTEVGLFASSDGGATWSSTNDGPANTPVMALFWLDSSTLVASTHGRGMFKTTVSVSTTNYNLTYTKLGAGSGTVTFSSGSNSSCSTSCSNSYAADTSVTLTANAGSGAAFSAWGGACSGSSSTCVVAMSAAKTVTATFNTATTYDLTYTAAGTGSGTVAFSSGSNLSCSSSCSNTYTSGTSVTLTATAGSGSTFSSWGGACSGSSSTCVVTMSVAKTVTATFNTATTYSYFGSENQLYCSNGSSATGFYFTTTIDGTSKSAYSTYYTSYATVTSGQKTVTISITNITCKPTYSGSFTYTLSPNYYYMFTLDGYSNNSWQITVYYGTSADLVRQNKTELTIPAKFDGSPNLNSESGILKKMDPNEKLKSSQ